MGRLSILKGFQYITPTAGDCNGPLGPVEFNNCNPEFRLSEIRRVFVAPLNAASFSDWKVSAEWEGRLSDSSTAGNDYIRTLVVRGNKPIPAAVQKLLTNNRRKNVTKNHTLNFLIDEVNETNHDFLRQLEAGPSRVKIWYETHGGLLFGGNDGIEVDLSMDMVLNEGEEEIQTYVGTAVWKSLFTEERAVSPIFNISSGGTVVVYDTILTFVSDVSDTGGNVTAAIPAVDPDTQFQFDAITPTPGTPVTMNINLNGVEVMIVTFPNDYLGEQFRFVDQAGEQHTGVFAAGNVNF